MPLYVSVPAQGEFLVRNGKVYEVVETDLKEIDEEQFGYLVWIWRNEDGGPLQCGW